jgi:4-amino-4-deoxy-L-arabinose transferase-like glycosyltransferase
VSRRALVLALGLLVVQAALLRTVFVPAPHPGGDNAAYLTLAHSLLDGEGYTELWDPAAPPHTKYPPVFPILVAVSMALGARGWGSLKAAPVVASLVGVLAVFLWARRRVRDEVAAGVAFLTGLSAAYLDHARWILSDIPFLAFLFLALWLLEALLPVPASGWTGIERDGPQGA